MICGVLNCGKRVRTVPDDMKPGGLALQQDQMEFVRAGCEPASMSRVRARQEGAQCTPGQIQEMRSMTWSLHSGVFLRNALTSGTARGPGKSRDIAEQDRSA